MQRPVDPSRVRALVVDENAASRLAMKELLGASGVTQVQQAADPIRAIRMLEAEPFGLVLCEAKFRIQMDGLQVLEYVRTRRLLAPSAAFVLVSAEADRSLVAAAREWQPDGFVLKPLTAASLAPRIEQALRRRALFAPLHEAADRGDAQALLARAARIAARLPGGPTLELMRWQVQAMLDLGRWESARELAERALALRDDLPWAELAIAHAEYADGLADSAAERLRGLIRVHPLFGGAYDLLIEILQRQGRTAKALVIAQAALEQIASSRRTRTLGELAFAHGELELAEKCYTDLIRKTSASLTRSALDVGLLGQVFVGQGETDKALRLVAGADDDTAADAQSQALAASVQAQAHAALGDEEAAAAAARRALSIAEREPASETVALLVARGAFSAGLREEAESLVRRTVIEHARHGATGALARKVLDDAGIAPDAFVAKALGGPAREHGVAGAARSTADEAARERYMSGRRGPGSYMQGPGSHDDATAGYMHGRSSEGDATGDASNARRADARERIGDGGSRSAPAVADALECVRAGRLEEAERHVVGLLRERPDDPDALMASVQVQMARMRTHGWDEAGAAEVKACLAALARLVPDRVADPAAGRIGADALAAD
jgi:CheY-like chemotaxis protein